MLVTTGKSGFKDLKYQNTRPIIKRVDNIQIRLISKIEWLLAKYECTGAPVK